MVEISVFLPVYNGERFLPETLKSIQAQRFSSFEVLCIDDCSTDKSAEMIQKAATDDARLTYLRPDKNLGSAARAIKFATHSAMVKWFVYSSQDDLFSSDWLSKLHARAIEANLDSVLPDVEFFMTAKATTGD